MKNIFALLLVLTSLVSCSQNANVSNLNAVEFKKAMETNPGLIIDVRTTNEFSRGHIAGAQLYSLQDPEIQTKLLALPKDKPLYFYCYSGGRSTSAINFLANNGYTKLYNLQKGIIDWNTQGFATTTDVNTTQAPQVDAFGIKDFNTIITEGNLVFVDFYAPWCAPCKKMAPSIEELKTTYAGKIQIVKVNGDASKELMTHHNISSIPYLVLYKQGKIVFSHNGFISKEELQAVFEKNL